MTMLKLIGLILLIIKLVEVIDNAGVGSLKAQIEAQKAVGDAISKSWKNHQAMDLHGTTSGDQ